MNHSRCLFFVLSLMLFISCRESELSELDVRDNLGLDEKRSNESFNINHEEFEDSLNKITYLVKTAEIGDSFSSDENDFFAEISDITIDNSDYLYVADSKMHRVFKFDSKHNFIFSFGRQGQGPGEFTGRLMISARDNKIYVSDHGNYRLLIFSSEGILLKQFPLPRNTYDRVIANSRGDMFLLSESGFFILDHYDASFKYIQSLLDLEYLLEFPLEFPPEKIYRQLMKMSPTSSFVLKLISNKDEICLVLNNSHSVICLDEHLNIKKQFRIEHPRFIADLKKRLTISKQKENWINAFGSAFFDNNGNICICYYNAITNIPEIYRYRASGEFIDTIRIAEFNPSSNRIVEYCDSERNFYGIDIEKSKILVYR